MINFKDKKYVLIFILSVFISVTTLIGGSYALIQRVLVGTNTYSMKTGNFLVEFSESQEITLSNQLPVYDNVGMNSGDEFSFSVTNNGNYVSSYSIKIEDLSTEGLGEVIRYAVDYGNGYSYDNIYALVNNKYIIQNKSLEVGGTDSYKLRFWLDIDATEAYIGKIFSAKVLVEATQEEYKYATNVLDAIYSSEDKEGLVAIGNDGLVYANGDIREYRYSGNNVNNYVWFNCDDGYTKGSEHCEKWRIIGSFDNTYENGVGTYKMLKIVRDEALSTTQKYNSNSGNKANFEGSSIQTYLNGTYYNSLKSNTKNLIIKAKWNIGTVLNTNNGINNYALEKNKLSYNYIGLINASDFGYASTNTLWNTLLNTTTITSENNWLYQENSMIINTPNNEGTKMYYISSNGLTEGNTTTAYSVRPTIYLKPDVSIINGYGTSEEPYELSIKYPINYGIKTEIKAEEITYNLNGGSGNVSSTLIGNNITEVIPTRKNFMFLGWSTNPDAIEAEYQSGDAYSGSPVTLYAVWVLHDAVYVYDYTGNVQEFSAEASGYYKIELWGAQGGSSATALGGKGAYTSGIVELAKNDKLNLYVGGAGTVPNFTNTSKSAGSYNGGAGAYYDGGEGGGATDIRFGGTSLNDRIMVAAGGGGSNTYLQQNGSPGGTLYSDKGFGNVTSYGDGSAGGASQIAGGIASTYYVNTTLTPIIPEAGSFGLGGAGSYHNTGPNGSGSGGAGYYGGGGAGGRAGTGSGGSSFISGYSGVNAITSNSSLTPTNNTIHYSDKYFISGRMDDGVNDGNGKIKITYIGKDKPTRVNTKLNGVRYIKDCITGNSVNGNAHWVELQALKDGVNMALNKEVTSTGTATSGTVARIVDGRADSSYVKIVGDDSNVCIVVDLENSYDLDEIAVWHYWDDNRVYNDNITYVSSDNSTWVEVINEYQMETYNGKRVSAYYESPSGYREEDLVLWYDAKQNVLTNGLSATTWGDLSTTDKEATVSGATWGTDYLQFESTSDSVDNVMIGEYNYQQFTLEVTGSFADDSITTPEYFIGNLNAGGYGIYRSASNTATGIAYITESGNYIAIYSSTLNPNQIYHIAFTYDGQYLRLYVNGKQVDYVEAPGTIKSPTNSTYLALGCNPARTSCDKAEYLNGKIYSARMYSSALSAEEIENNYLNDSNRFNF